MNKPTGYVSPTEEIDLTEIARKLILFLRRNQKIILIFTLLGIALGLVAYYTLPRKYDVQMIASTRLLSSLEVTDIVESWDDLLDNGEYALLSKKFNVPVEVIVNVSSFKALSTGVDGRANAKDAFAIEAEVRDNAHLNALQQGIVHYLETNPYVLERLGAEKRRLNSLKNRIAGEIAQLDSVKLSLQNLIRRGGNNSNAFIAEPGTINKEIVQLYTQQLTIEESLQFIENIQVITGFDRRENPDFPKLPLCLIAGAVLGLLLALVVTFFRALNV
jgi:hypothetical protein